MADDDSPLGSRPRRTQQQDGQREMHAGGPSGPAWYKVVAGGTVAHNKGQVDLPKGEIISSEHYDVEKLKNAGIGLEPAEPPAWWKDVQARAAEAAPRRP